MSRKRWQNIFADLEAQFDEAAAGTERAEAASRARAEMGAVRLRDRLRGALGHPLVLRCRGAGPVTGVLAEVGVDWLLLEEDGGREALVAAGALLAVGGLGRRTAVDGEPGPVQAKLDLRHGLRALARDRATVQVILEDGGVLSGTIDRVGADFLELAEHSTEQPRRPDAVYGVRAVVVDRIAVVRTVPPSSG